MRKKVPAKVQMKGIDPQFFFLRNYQSVPRAFESLNPALVGRALFMLEVVTVAGNNSKLQDVVKAEEHSVQEAQDAGIPEKLKKFKGK
jgi:hypothetical protein